MAKAKQEKVTTKHIVAELAEKHDLPKKQMATYVDDLMELITRNLKKGNAVSIPGLGILKVSERAERMGRNPATGESIKIPAKKKVAFRVSKDLKEAVGS